MKYRVYPSPWISLAAILGGIVVLIFVIILGLSLLPTSPAGSLNANPQNKTAYFIIGAIIFCMVTAAVISICYHITNLASPGALAPDIAESEDDEPNDETLVIRHRLEALEDLKHRNLITEPEYKTKRDEILSKL